MEITDFNIMETVRDAAKYGDKIDSLIKAKKEWENAKADAQNAMNDLARKKTETDNYVNAKKAELAAKQLEHDKAAKEAADRIELAKSQMAEVLKVRAENNAVASQLDGHERDLEAREKILKDQQSGISKFRAQLELDRDLVSRQLAHIAAMPKQ